MDEGVGLRSSPPSAALSGATTLLSRAIAGRKKKPRRHLSFAAHWQADRIVHPPWEDPFVAHSLTIILKNHHSFRKGFTLVELLVVIAIILVMAGVLVPVGQGMIGRSHTINCGKNLRQIGLATLMYAGDNQMKLPSTSHQRGGNSWTLTLQPYASSTLTSKCAEDANKLRMHTYVLNDFLTKNPAGADHLDYSILAKIARPETTFMFAEAAPSHTSDHFHFTPYFGGKVPSAVFDYQVAVGTHVEKANYLFADGHVETLSRQEIKVRLEANGTRFVDPSDGGQIGN
jgi:prepilin-type N-terminal cleavage/methylation domain-containing protein/prepilin-type processing-associated H-X9-DG protein